MAVLVGILAAVALVVAYYRLVRPAVRDLRWALTVQPDEVQLRREQRAALIFVTVFLVLVTAGVIVLAEAILDGAGVTARWVIGGGAVGLLAALWSPWGGLRIVASLSLITVTIVGVFSALLIAAGGPDSRGENLPQVGVILVVALLIFLLPFLLLAHAEFWLWRLRAPRGGSA